MKKNKNHKYPHQRVEQRRTAIDARGMNERRKMEKQAKAKMTIGTFTLFKPKPDAELSSFTLAFDRPVPKDELYVKIGEALIGYWDGEPVKSVIVRLSKPIPLRELRNRLKQNLKELFQT